MTAIGILLLALLIEGTAFWLFRKRIKEYLHGIAKKHGREWARFEFMFAFGMGYAASIILSGLLVFLPYVVVILGVVVMTGLGAYTVLNKIFDKLGTDD